MVDDLSELSSREKRQTSSIADVGRARSFLKNSSVIKLFAKVSKQAGAELELCKAMVLRDYMLEGGKNSEQCDAVLKGLKDFIAIFADCEETIYEESKQEGEDEASDGEDND